MPNATLRLPSRFNLAAWCLSPTSARPELGRALVMDDGENPTIWTWGELRRRCAAWQEAFREAGVARGERVALRLGNSADFPLAFLAAAGLGAIPIPLSPQLTEEELRYIVADATPTIIAHDSDEPSWKDGIAQRVRYVAATDLTPTDRPLYTPELDPETPGYMVYTSGTTGAPRGVLHAHRAVYARTMMREGWTGIERGDTVLHAGQLNWTYAMGIAVFDAWSVGATSVLWSGDRQSEVWPTLIERWKATIFAAVPSVYRQMLKRCPELERQVVSLRHGLCAGEALPPVLYDEWTARTGKPLYEALGMSECSTYISSGPATPVRKGSPGRPQAGRRIAILPQEGGEEALGVGEVGLLAVHRSDPGLMLRYWNAPDDEARVLRGEWFIGGDLAHLDHDGYVWFHGRADELMNALGYRVSPLEVEAAIEKHPAVREVAVTTFPVRDDLSLVAAWIVAEKEAVLPNREAFDAWLGEELAAYKRPKLYFEVASLPRNRSGKVLRRALAEAKVLREL